MSETSVDVVKWYTRARKFPQLIGKTPDGKKLWGGPYTITQALGFVLVLLVGSKTMWLWGTHGFIGNLLLLACVAFGVVYGLGKIPVGSRNPLSVTSGIFKAVASPQHGRLAGRPVRIRRPHRLRHTMVMGLPTPPPGFAAAASTTPARPAPAPADRAPTRRPRRWLPTEIVRFHSATRLRPGHQPTQPPATGQPASPDLTGIQELLAAAQPAAPALTGIQGLLASATTTHRSENAR